MRISCVALAVGVSLSAVEAGSSSESSDAESSDEDCVTKVTYRSLDGTCNSLSNSDFGKAGGPFSFETEQQYVLGSDQTVNFLYGRELQGSSAPLYANVPPDPPDGFFCSPTGKTLQGSDTRACNFKGFVQTFQGIGPTFTTNPRKVSNTLHATEFGQKKTETEQGVSLMATFFGQFVAHDLAGDTVKQFDSPACGIDIGDANLNDPNNAVVKTGVDVSDDPIFQFLFFPPVQFPTRVVTGPKAEVITSSSDDDDVIEGLTFFNERTAWADLDGLYGVSDDIGAFVRSFQEGKLRFSDYTFGFGQTPLPFPVSFQGLPPPFSDLPQRGNR